MSRISRVGLIEGKSIVQIQIDPFVTHFSATAFVPTGIALMYYNYAHRKQSPKCNLLQPQIQSTESFLCNLFFYFIMRLLICV